MRRTTAITGALVFLGSCTADGLEYGGGDLTVVVTSDDEVLLDQTWAGADKKALRQPGPFTGVRGTEDPDTGEWVVELADPDFQQPTRVLGLACDQTQQRLELLLYSDGRLQLSVSHTVPGDLEGDVLAGSMTAAVVWDDPCLEGPADPVLWTVEWALDEHVRHRSVSGPPVGPMANE